MSEHGELFARLELNVPCFDSEGNNRKKPCGYDGGLCGECRKKQDAADAIRALMRERDYFRDAFAECANQNSRLMQREADRAKGAKP